MLLWLIQKFDLRTRCLSFCKYYYYRLWTPRLCVRIKRSHPFVVNHLLVFTRRIARQRSCPPKTPKTPKIYFQILGILFILRPRRELICYFKGPKHFERNNFWRKIQINFCPFEWQIIPLRDLKVKNMIIFKKIYNF